MYVRTIKTSNFVNIKCRLVYKTDPAKKVQRKKNRNPLFFISWTFTRGKSSSREWKRKKIWIFLKHKHLIFGYIVNTEIMRFFFLKRLGIYSTIVYYIHNISRIKISLVMIFAMEVKIGSLSTCMSGKTSQDILLHELLLWMNFCLTKFFNGKNVSDFFSRLRIKVSGMICMLCDHTQRWGSR